MINFMRNADSPFLADLLAISLRWLVLFGLCISLGVGGVFLPDRSGDSSYYFTLTALVLPALWNGFVSALAIFNRRLPLHRQINVGLDILFGVALYLATGGLSGAIAWVTLLPLFSGAVYYNARGAFLVAGIMSLFQASHAYLVTGGAFQLMAAGVMAAINLLGALMVSLLSTPLIMRLRNTYQGTVQQRKEVARTAQRLERDRMRALFAMIETFSSTLNYQTVLETALETAISALDSLGGSADEMVGAVLLFGGQRLQVTASRRFAACDLPKTLAGDAGVVSEALHKGEMQLLSDPSSDSELGELATMQNQKVALCMPLIRGMNAFGVMLFGHKDDNFFTAERTETLQMLGNQVVISLQNARLYQDLAHEKERIVQSQEEAQKKLARDLHDGPTQSVAAIAMRISIARRMLERSPGEASEELSKIEDLARRTSQEIRHMLFTLRPLVLESEGLVAALKMMADKMHELYQQTVVIDVEPGVILQLESSRQTVIFYLTEEAVNNARKHAQATEIRVRLICVPKIEDVAMLEIADNGVGFDLESVMNTYDRRGSLGMINLRERADQINGLLKIDSTPGNGTRIRVFVPLTEEAADRLHQRR
jgi:signal transduction histidine kinase